MDDQSYLSYSGAPNEIARNLETKRMLDRITEVGRDVLRQIGSVGARCKSISEEIVRSFLVKCIVRAAAVSFGIVASALAQELPSEAVVSPISKAGVTEGCSVQYTAVTLDHVYKSGTPVGISGSLAWMLHPRTGIGASLKLIAADIDAAVPNSLRPFEVSHAFVRINGKVFQVSQRYKCDQVAGFCGIIGMSDAMDAYEAFARGGEVVSVGYNRSENAMDVAVPLPALNLDQNNQLNVCMLDILERAKAQMGGHSSR